MVLSVDIFEKSFGDKVLYEGLRFDVLPGEKVGLIGRNGTGKSTLFNIITGDDTDYEGEIYIKKGAVVIASRQEHHGHESKTVLEYILGDLPEYAKLSHIITSYPEHMGSSSSKMQQFSDALERFTQLGYYQVEDELGQSFEAYQLAPELMHASLHSLSGGQKRMVELIKVQRARGHLALIDEPTNHMDFIAKKEFIKWFKAAREAVLVITHDRDVLREVNRIVEIRDGQAYTFKGNYDDYLRVNTDQITSQVNEYDLIQRRIRNLTEDVIRFKRLKERARDPGTIHRFKSSQLKAEAELEVLQGKERPSFWIDRESAGDLNEKMTVAYDKYKARNIRVRARRKASDSFRLLVEATKLSLGYDDHVLFKDVSFQLHEGERIRLHGRNGAGKTTLIQAILAKAENRPASSQKFSGHIATEASLAIGLYEQEIPSRYLDMTLADAIELVLAEKNMPVSDTKVQQFLSDYLFNPASDGDVQISRLSGGQKARFQLISMLCNDPQLLVLDEPTNHLDLPSIEELEDSLKDYHGAIIFISHDSYFAQRLGGTTVAIGA